MKRCEMFDLITRCECVCQSCIWSLIHDTCLTSHPLCLAALLHTGSASLLCLPPMQISRTVACIWLDSCLWCKFITRTIGATFYLIVVHHHFFTCNLKFFTHCSKCGKFMYRFWHCLAKTFQLQGDKGPPDPPPGALPPDTVIGSCSTRSPYVPNPCHHHFLV